MALRALRIAAVAAGLFYLFDLSRRAGIVRGNPELPGTLWAIGVVSLLFSLRALVTELTRDTSSILERDFLWGLSAGGLVTVLARL